MIALMSTHLHPFGKIKQF